MDTKKIRVGIISGGKSPEHEISLQSKKNIVDAIDRDRFDVVEIYIDQKGQWDTNVLKTVDAVFPVLHGTNGEDGTIQGLLELAEVPYVGSGVLGSSVAMDKDVAKHLLRDAGIVVARWVTLHRGDVIDLDAIGKKLGWPVFVKPARLGSSVGVSKARNPVELEAALELAFRYDTKILIEEYISGDEVECSVLGNDEPKASVVGKIIPRHEFYSYEAKYLDPEGAALEIPAKIPDAVAQQVRQISMHVFQILNLSGFARVDSRIHNGTEIIVNEANTIPGFTNISMFPKLWEASGLPYRELITRLIELAMERFADRQKLETTYRQ